MSTALFANVSQFVDNIQSCEGDIIAAAKLTA
jgi:hypothetical protein